MTGINGLFPSGHFASTAAIGMRADNMWRLHTLLPVPSYLDGGASPSYYMHHPLGVFWTVAALGKIFGFSNWVLRLPAIIYVTATPFFLYRIGRALWGPIEGGLAALAFVALPITLGYTNYHDLEQPVMFGTVVALWGYVRFVRTWRERYAIVSVLGFFFALNHDWQAYIWGVFFLGWLFVRGFLLPERALGAVRARPFGRYWALMCIVAVAAFGIEIIALDGSGRLSDLLSSFFGRTAGSAAPLDLVLHSRRYRIELMFSALGIALGKLALLALLARLALKRSESDVLPLCFLLAALVPVPGLQAGRRRPHLLAAPLRGVLRARRGRARGDGARGAGVARAAAAGSPPAPGRTLDRARARGPARPRRAQGRRLLARSPVARERRPRFAEANLPSTVDEATALRWFRARVPATSPVATPRASSRTGRSSGRPARASCSATSRSAARRRRAHVPARLARRVRLGAARHGDAHPRLRRRAVLARRSARGPRAALGVSLRRARAVAARGVVARPRRARAHDRRRSVGDLGVAQAPRLGGDRAQRRARDDRPAPHRAQRRPRARRRRGRGPPAHRARRAARLAGPREVRKRHRARIGAVRHRGAQRGFALYFVAGAFKSDTKFSVHARVIGPPRLSTLPMDPADLELVTSPVWPTSLWKPGAIYTQDVVVHHRPGKERFTGTWAGLRRTDGPDPLELATTY